MLTIAVVNQKGGVGKSTLAQNLAGAAHLAGKRTVLLDLDLQGSTIDWSLRRSETSKLRGLTVLEAPRVIPRHHFLEMTKPYDVVICDGPARLSEVSAAAAVSADIVLIPLRVGYSEFWAAADNEKLLDTADATRAQLGLEPVRRVYVLNEVFPNIAETKAMVEAISESVTLLDVRLHHRVMYDRARGAGECTLTAEPKGAAAREIRSLFASLVAMVGAPS